MENKLHGYTKITYSNGDEYEGEWKNGCRVYKINN